MGLFLDPAATAELGAPNAMRLSYHPKALRPYIVNWEATAAAFIQWLHRDLLRTGDVETRRLLDELLSYPDVPTQWQLLDLDASTAPFLAIELKKGDVRFSFFTLLASLGTVGVKTTRKSSGVLAVITRRVSASGHSITARCRHPTKQLSSATASATTPRDGSAPGIGGTSVVGITSASVSHMP